jgi:5-methylcytosine-specific restriction endonuclease McrA
MELELPDVVYVVPTKAELRKTYGEWFWLADKLVRKIHLRTILSERQNHRCAICGRATNLEKTSKARATVEHVLPVCRGGRDHPDDCVMACWRCNQKRRDKVIPEEQIVLVWRGMTPVCEDV